jgi:hypothetical protein
LYDVKEVVPSLAIDEAKLAPVLSMTPSATLTRYSSFDTTL